MQTPHAAPGPPPARRRREPPPFRPVTVAAVEDRGPRMRRITLAGPAMVGFPVPLPAASVRVLVPTPGTDALVVPAWTGNEFLLPDGRRPALRTFTPHRIDPDEGTLAIDVVLHGDGVAAHWASRVEPGAPAAVSGPGRGYPVDPAARSFLLAGDETALPAIEQLLDAIAPMAAVRVHVEVAEPDARAELPTRAGTTITWHDLADRNDPGSAMAAAVLAEAVDPADPTLRIWVAGEAASVQRVRRHLFETAQFPRSNATVRGYWKRGRSEDSSDE